MLRRPLLLLLLTGAAHGAVINPPAGTTAWADLSPYPAPADEVWMNTASSTLTLSAAALAEIDKLIVGRHALDTRFEITGGTLAVGGFGGTGQDILFVGQYNDASGFVAMEAGHVEVNGELAVAVAGPGSWAQSGGSAVISDRLVVGRYNTAAAVGSLVLRGGSMLADRLDVNDFSEVLLRGGILALVGDETSDVTNLISQGKIRGEDDAGAAATPKVRYDAVSDRTYVYARMTRLNSNYYGQTLFDRKLLRGSSEQDRSLAVGELPSWFDSTLWQPNSIPTFGSEAWMNQADTAAAIRRDEIAAVDKLIVGRHVGPVELTVDVGGELLVGDDESSGAVLFAGQYEASVGRLFLKEGGRIRVMGGEMAIGVSGAGLLDMEGGTVSVSGPLKVGRYDKTTAVGTIALKGGSIHASSLQINGYSTVDITGGVLSLAGDVQSNVNDLAASGKLTAHGGAESIIISYDGQRTTVRAPVLPTSSPTPAPSRTPSVTPTTLNPTEPITPNPTLAPSNSPSKAPTAEPTSSPTKYIAPEDWDIRGILLMDEAKIGPRLPDLDKTSTAIRTFTPAPEYGVHPRIFFGPDNIPAIRANLESTRVGQEVRAYAKQLLALLVYGRNACGGKCYNDIPSADRVMPDGRSKVSNPGLFHTHPTYTELIAGTCTTVMSQSGTHTNVLAGGMAIEAFDLLIFPDQTDAASRKTNLAAAMSNWATCALADSEFGPNTRDKVGGQHLAFAYDLAYNYMSESQRAVVRRAIATMLWTPDMFYGIDTEGYATTSNWVALNSFAPMMLLAIEGETDKAVDGWSTQELEDYFRDIMITNYKFLTYGFYEEGSGYEGAGKNYQFNAAMTAYAKRGYNFFAHRHVQAYAKQFLPALLQPYGHFVTTYDTIGGSGTSAPLGGQKYHANDIIGLKWAYPQDPAVDFIYRQYLETPYFDSSGVKQIFLDIYDQKITPRSTYQNNFLMLMMMASDYGSGSDFESMNSAAHGGSLTYHGKERGLVITRTGFAEDALALNFHVRQDTGGHTYGDRNSFTFSGLGRLWIRNPVGYLPETEWSSGILVNGQGITISPQDGRKARMPARIAAFQDEALATFTFGDATYAYNTQWKWCTTCRAVGSNGGIGGWNPVYETWNDFRHPNNQVQESFGDVPFVDYANWRYGGYTEAMHKLPSGLRLSQAYRQAGLVRGTYPYALIVDDVHKITNAGDPTPEWTWIAQLPPDLTMVDSSQYASISKNLDASMDLVLQEPPETGTRKLLVRVLNAEGTATGLGALKEHPTDKIWDNPKTSWRLAIKRVASRPRFRIMLYPFDDSQPVPEYKVKNGSVQLKFANGSGNTDTLKFHTETRSVGGMDVEMTGIEVSRSGNLNVIDTRNQATPMEIRG